MKILLDTNIVLDLLLLREPFVKNAREIFLLIENGDIEGYLCATSVTTLHYLVSREKSKKETNEIIENILTLFKVAPVDKKVLQIACKNNGNDYEDSVIYTASDFLNIDIIITRDKKGFLKSDISTMTSKEFMAFWMTKL